MNLKTSSFKVPIFVAGYPKSGTTWLTRLLGDVLQAPTGGCIPRLDETEVATEGYDRISDFVVRKGHFVLDPRSAVEWGQDPHVLSGSSIYKYKVVHIMRDPRDIAVSVAHHWNMSINAAILQMTGGTGGFKRYGSWSKYVSSWIAQSPQVLTVRFADLLQSGLATISQILQFLDLEVAPEAIEAAYSRQSFARRKEHIEKHGEGYPLGKEFNMQFMRAGQVGDWKNYFTRTLAFSFHAHFSDDLKRFDYERSADWWKL